jgi:hypothetical protein
MIAFTLFLVVAVGIALATLLVPLADFLTDNLTGSRVTGISPREIPLAARPAQSAA